MATVRWLRPWSVASTPHTRLFLEHVCATSTSTPGNGSVQRLAWHRWAQTCHTPITIMQCTSVLCPHLALGHPLPRADGNQPLVLTYADLDPNVQYRVRVVYSYQGWSAYPLQSLWAVGADNTTAMLHGDQVPLPPPTLCPHAASRATCSRRRSLFSRRSGMFPRTLPQQAK